MNELNQKLQELFADFQDKFSPYMVEEDEENFNYILIEGFELDDLDEEQAKLFEVFQDKRKKILSNNDTDSLEDVIREEEIPDWIDNEIVPVVKTLTSGDSGGNQPPDLPNNTKNDDENVPDWAKALAPGVYSTSANTGPGTDESQDFERTKVQTFFVRTDVQWFLKIAAVLAVVAIVLITGKEFFQQGRVNRGLGLLSFIGSAYMAYQFLVYNDREYHNNIKNKAIRKFEPKDNWRQFQWALECVCYTLGGTLLLIGLLNFVVIFVAIPIIFWLYRGYHFAIGDGKRNRLAILLVVILFCAGVIFLANKADEVTNALSQNTNLSDTQIQQESDRGPSQPEVTLPPVRRATDTP